ncbi:uncharacterized protein V2V93DRAFT_371117 [Kockiozyma suomiensis]|uniref:uncharacterized protein n=1 Tax=Kockiozyma suomiensis TaxID=1337062 RepID=UPI003343D79E
MPTIPPEPFDATPYVPMIDAILSRADLEQITARRIRNAIQAIYDVDFSPYKKLIDGVIVERFNAIQDEVEEAKPKVSSQSKSKAERSSSVNRSRPTGSASSRSANSSSPAVKSQSLLSDAEIAEQLHRELNQGRGGRVRTTSRPKRTSSATASGEGKKRKINRNNPFNARMLLSEPLSAFLGQTELSRPECVKTIWNYIKEHDLQNPRDKREILCDDRMRPIFGDKTHMFTMNKILAKHLYRREDVTGVEVDDDELVHSNDDEDDDSALAVEDEEVGAILKGE